MFKKVLVSLVVFLVLVAAGLRYVGVSIFAVDEALVVSTGFGAKLACSKRTNHQ